MKFYIALLFITINVINMIHSQSYSINPFLDKIIEDKTYDLLKDLKFSFGAEVSIEICLLIYPTNDCNKVVMNYMPTFPSSNNVKTFIQMINKKNVKKLTEKEKRNNYQLLKSKLFTHNGRSKKKINVEIIADKIAKKYFLIFSTFTA